MKYASIVLATLLATSFAASAANYKAPAPVKGMQSSGMHIDDQLDDSCQTKLSQAIDLRDSVVDFTVSRNQIDTVAAWPLVCSPTVEAKTVSVERMGSDLTITYVNNDDTLHPLTLTLQRVESESEDDAPAYQIVQVGDMSAMGYQEQADVKDWLLDCYAATLQTGIPLSMN
ncbi:hypothetical protein pEaSNUABM13_00298 [Erwinia phage pEa_SNUABM_13]|nr:hypothetical protein pEaSNUABM13_00298 [Erwinia phage pEa_SNUABM_13]QYW03598.1 hypothetical protein pEaSNUABM34_00296 [Erwinia phage pEa_SNUABM_34]QYW05311.1 hypothetical protein pEaSNUABM21_00297 [Erwinia phage pEa_SNUABM_21]